MYGRIMYYDLTIVFGGTLHYEIDGEKYTVGAGDALLIRPSEMRKREGTDADAEYVSINFLADDEITLPTLLHDRLDGEMRILISLFEECRKKDTPLSQRRLSDILALIMLTLSDVDSRRVGNPTAEKIKRYLLDNVRGKISLSEISELTFYTPAGCNLLFKREFGKSVNDYFLDLKTEMAKELIIGGSMKIHDVAEYMGYPDYNYFSRLFKKRTGRTPTEYYKMFHK